LVSVISAILVVASAWFFFFGNIQAARASNAVIKGLSFPVKEATKNFQEAYKISPVSRSEIPEQFSRRIIELIASSSENEKEDLKKGLLAVEETFKKGIQEDPPNFRMRLFLGEFYNSAHQYAHSSDLLDISEQVLNQAMQLSPKNQQVYWGLGQTMLFKQQYRKAGEYFQKAIDLEPHLAESHWYMFLCYKVQSEYNSAQKEFYNADSLGYAWRKNAGAVKQVIDLYRYLLRNDMIVSVAEEAVKRFPKDAQLWGMLGDGYAAIGEREKAKAAAEKVMELRPDLRPQLEQFLSDLGY
jgi:tetratricopeptide (TPR) repeat protein